MQGNDKVTCCACSQWGKGAMFLFLQFLYGHSLFPQSHLYLEVVGWCEGVMYLMSPGRPTDIGLQLGKACYPCSR